MCIDNIPSPLLLIGDVCLSKKIIVNAKKKYNDACWFTLNVSEQSIDEIRCIVGSNNLFSQSNIFILEDIPNRNQVREFLLDLLSTSNVKFILFDSNNHIKYDIKTKTYNKTWCEFIDKFKKISGNKIIDNGLDFTDKENLYLIKYIQDGFKKYDIVIDDNTSMVFSDIVGRNRAIILSEIQKLSINCPKVLTESFIIENTFPITYEGTLYKFNNAIDYCSFNVAISSLEHYLSIGTNSFLLSEILMKKARWQLAVSHLWYSGSAWSNIPDELMNMGKFPSSIWQNNKYSINDKKRLTYEYINYDNKINYMKTHLGYPDNSFNYDSEKNDSGESLPLRFIAQQIVDFIRGKIVEPNKNKYSEDVLKEKILTRGLTVYLEVSDMLKDIRYNQKDTINSLYSIIYSLTNNSLS